MRDWTDKEIDDAIIAEAIAIIDRKKRSLDEEARYDFEDIYKDVPEEYVEDNNITEENFDFQNTVQAYKESGSLEDVVFYLDSWRNQGQMLKNLPRVVDIFIDLCAEENDLKVGDKGYDIYDWANEITNWLEGHGYITYE